MIETIILFAHYKTDLATQASLNLVRIMHPDALVIPVSTGDMFLDSVNANSPKNLTEKLRANFTEPWKNADLFLYAGYEHAIRNYPEAKRYIFYEYDTRCFVSNLQEALEPWWNCACAVPSIQKFPENIEWFWFTEMHKLPVELRRFAMGVNSLSVLMFSGETLKKLVASVRKFDNFTCFCELRLGTLLNYCEIPVADMKLSGVRYIPEWGTAEMNRNGPGIYHPVKSCPMLP